MGYTLAGVREKHTMSVHTAPNSAVGQAALMKAARFFYDDANCCLT